ncbi:hypothetical protein JOD43_003681 [Pullulanibacillus pueri]|uniref:DUF2953 domain-containing protein n=1 Tax=Pullulanibacillus pueri TaxID=1437324 RepID=A0A8J2ZYW3_9BACL|nr:DUF2953 domain-containing protein [Pullulanibacillus pueri]MBM7683501.1 hypothetical protein [Pullulanibacillus pueri]GGH86678.1 hypothetical protein GCM10007096_34940 [Pullulanibacillus pueri]
MKLLVILSIVVLLIILFLLLVIFATISIAIDGRVLNTKIDFKVTLKCLGIRFLFIQYPNPDQPMSLFNKAMTMLENWRQQRKDNGQELPMNDLEQLLELFGALKNKPTLEEQMIQFSMDSLRIKEIKWYSTIGFEEADKTAWLTGVLWTLKTTFLGFIQHYFLKNKMDAPSLIVQPDYSQVFTFKTHLTCMIQFRLGHAIRTAYKIAKQRKGRQETCQKNIQYKV